MTREPGDTMIDLGDAPFDVMVMVFVAVGSPPPPGDGDGDVGFPPEELLPQLEAATSAIRTPIG
jgi:hypothetical protein